MPETKHEARVARLIAEYYARLDQAKLIQEQATDLKIEILRLAENGRYGRYTIGECKDKEIHVNSFTRTGFRYIRRNGR